MRQKNALNIHYKYELTFGDKHFLFRSMDDMKDGLEISKSTAQRMIKYKEYIPRKFSYENYELKKVHIPIYENTRRKIEYKTINETFNYDIIKKNSC